MNRDIETEADDTAAANAVVIHALLSESSELGRAERSFLASGDKLVGGMASLLVAAIPLMFAHGRPFQLALVALPYAAGALFIWLAQTYTERFARAGLRAYVDEMIVCALGRPLPLEESLLRPILSPRRLSVIWSGSLLGLSLAVSCAVSVGAAVNLSERHSVAFGLADGLCLTALVVPLGVALWEMNAAYRKGYAAGKDHEKNCRQAAA